MPKVCIVIPFYNEASRFNLEAFIIFLENEPDYSLMLVNDGSSDDTLSKLEALAKVSPQRISITNLKQNAGKAEAIRQGMQKAWRWSNHDFFGYMDADLATPLEEAPRLVSHFADYHIQFVIGSRIKLYGWNINRSIKRHYFGRVFATYVGFLFKLEIYDTQCGAKFFTNCLAQDLFKEKFVSKWFFDIELILRLKKRMGKHFDTSLIEVPLTQWHEMGESKLKISDFLKTPFELAKIKRHYHR